MLTERWWGGVADGEVGGGVVADGMGEEGGGGLKSAALQAV